MRVVVLVITFSAFINGADTQNYNRDDQQQQQQSYFHICAPFNCGNISFSFPFSSVETFGSGQFDCGLPQFEVACDGISSEPTIRLSGRSYQVKQLHLSDNLITVVDNILIYEISLGSCNHLGNLTISGANDDAGVGFMLPVGGVNLTIFECLNGVSLSNAFLAGVVGNFTCSGKNSTAYIWRGTQLHPQLTGTLPSECNYISLPSLESLNRSGSNRAQTLLADVLRYGFPLQWANLSDCADCEKTGGRCGYDGSSRKIVCLCNGDCTRRPHDWKLIAGATIGSTSLLAVVFLLMIKYKWRILVIFKPSLWGKNQKTGDERTAKEFIKTYQSTLLSNYSLNDINKMTNGFKDKLGEGGYGSVFKGRLSDGRFVAVKMLENYKDDSQSFLNEVTTIGYIHHVNVIRLLGFCWDRSKQAIIYEYMPNKSLGDLMSKSETSFTLGLAKLLEIAIGVAHGIEYLHNGCESRILHLDIKPQNVLLDQNFCPKISDFGLAKVYSRNQSAVTITEARGTIGYIAPEVFLRNLGKPSDKADVYSFGMLLLELVGAKRHVEPIESGSSEVYFPGWIYDKLIQERDHLEINDSVMADEVYGWFMVHPSKSQRSTLYEGSD